MSKLEELKKMLLGDEKDIEKTVPIPTNCQQYAEQVKILREQKQDIEDKLQHVQRKFWVAVEEELQIFTGMRMNLKDNTIEILKDDTRG